MAVGKEAARGPLWVDGRFTARVRGPGAAPGRIVRVRRPFALIGRLPGADIRVDDPAAEPRHALLVLDRRGIFGVDLLTGTGTRFAGAAAGSAWLGAGDVLEVAGHRVELLQLRVDGLAIDPRLSDDDPLAGPDDGTLAAVTLEPLDVDGPPWMLGSALAFLGRGDACAIRIEDESASDTHCALLRGPAGAYVIDLLGRPTLLDGRPVDGAAALVDGDVLTIGAARFSIRVEPAPAPTRAAGTAIAVREPISQLPAGRADGPPGALVAWLIDAVERPAASPRDDVLDALRQFQCDTATLLGAQIDRIEALHREIASLRDEARDRRGPPPCPAAPLDLDLAPPGTPGTASADPAAWLLERINGLERESRSTWKDVLGRITSAVGARRPPETSPEPGTSIAVGPPEAPDGPRA